MKPSPSSESSKENAKPQTEADPSSSDRILDYNTLTKHLVPHSSTLPDTKETPSFNHHAFYANLAHYQPRNLKESGTGAWGKTLLYGEVVTSTNTLLEKNPALLSCLPDGFTATATTQVAGRGRAGLTSGFRRRGV